jgi:hypothetical protein
MSRTLIDFINGSRALRAIKSANGRTSTPAAVLALAANLGAPLVLLAALAIGGVAIAENYHSNPWLLSWIPPTCCVTNDCCWEVTEREVRPVSADSWGVLATGQVLARSAWSPDGKFYRCACDLADGKWIRHQGANTRCLFVPLRSAALKH